MLVFQIAKRGVRSGGGKRVGVLDGGIFHIEQISMKISTLSDAFGQRDPMVIGLSLQTLSVAAHIARSQFTPTDRAVALSWRNWTTGLGFLDNCVAGVMDGDPDFVALTNDLLSLSHEESLHMLALAEEADRHLS